MKLKLVKTAALLSLLIAACTTNQKSNVSNDKNPTGISTDSHAIFSNGGFESDGIGDAPTDWTVTTYLNDNPTSLDSNNSNGLLTLNPLSLADLNLSLGTGVANTEVVGNGTAESQQDPELGSAGTLRYPKYDTRTVRVNRASVVGKNNNVNSISQTMTLSAGDVDPDDGQVHLRFAVAPVLQDPGHNAWEQPYFFVQVKDLTKNTVLYRNFNYANQPGVPWQSDGGSIQYTDWQLVDVAPGSAADIGDQIEMLVLAAGCSRGGHWGRVYVDAFGTTIPGPFVSATAASTAYDDTDLTYTLRYKNGGSGSAANAIVDFTTPPNTTFQSVSQGGCTSPSVGAAGTISCNLGTLAAGDSGTYTITVHIDPGTTGLVTAGTYQIAATGISALLGAKVETTVSSAGSGVPDSISVVSGNSQSTQISTDFSQPLVVIVKDSLNNPVPNATVTFTPPGSGASAAISGTLTTDSNGEVSVTATANSVAGGPYTVNASVSGVASPAAFSLTNLVGPAGSIAIVSGNSQTRQVSNSFSQPLVVIVKDAGDNPVPGATVTFTPPGSGASAAISGTTTTDSNGEVSVTATANTVAGGPYNVSASTTGVASPVNFSLTNTPGAAASIAVVGGDSQSAQISTAFSQHLVAVVKDAYDNLIPNATVTFTPPGSGASAAISGTTNTDSNGEVSVTATANTVAGGPYNVNATVSGVSSPAVFSLTNLVGAPGSISIVSGSNQSTQVHTDFSQPLVVVVRDAGDNAVPGVAVTFTPPGSGASAAISGTLTTDSNGEVSVTATANTVAGGPYNVSASAAGVASPVNFALTNTIAPPGSITVVSGGAFSVLSTPAFSQATIATTSFLESVVVQVTDPYGNPVPNASVDVTVPSTGASASYFPLTVTTDSSGLASVDFVANDKIGTFTASLSCVGTSSAAAVSLTNNPVPTTTTLSVDNASPKLDDHPVLTATVASNLDTPTGKVKFLIDDKEYEVVDLESGVATLSIRLTTIGDHTIKAVYDAQTYFGASAASAGVVASRDSGTLNGGGCSAETNDGGFFAMMMAFALVWIGSGSLGKKTRKPTLVARTLVLIAAFVAGSSSRAVAQTSPGAAINVFHTAPAGSNWFTLDSLDFRRNLRPDVRVLLDYTHNPLVVYNSNDSRRIIVVSQQLWANVGSNIVFGNRFRFSTNVPVAYQSSNSTLFNGVQIKPTSKGGIGDVWLQGDLRLFGNYDDKVTVASGVGVLLPTGSQSALLGNGKTTIVPHVAISAKKDIYEYAANVGFAFRSGRIADLAFNKEFQYSVAGGLRFFERLLIGPEIYGLVDIGPSAGEKRHPGLEIDLGAHYQWVKNLRTSFGVGRGFVRSAGEPDYRFLASLDFSCAAEKEKPKPVETPVPTPTPTPIEPTPTPTPTPPPVVEETPKSALVQVTNSEIVILKQVLFDTDKDIIKAESYPVLEEVAGVLKTTVGIKRVSIEGHTDSKGNAKHNLNLSERRAKSVKRWLVEHGIEEQRLESHGFGQTRPINDNGTEQGRSANRRVEFHITVRTEQ